jgi:hypothetical protein
MQMKHRDLSTYFEKLAQIAVRAWRIKDIREKQAAKAAPLVSLQSLKEKLPGT